MAFVTTVKHHQNAVYVGRNEMYLRGIGYGVDGVADLRADGTMLISGHLPGGTHHKLKGLFDTGAKCDVMGLAAWERIKGNAMLLQSPIHLLMADGSSMRVMGMTPSIVLDIAGHQLEMNFVVVSGLAKEDFLLGRSY